MASLVRHPVVVLPFVAIFLTCASLAGAQTPDSVPRELAAALVFDGVPGEQCRIHVGEAPEGFTMAWPEGTIVLGASETANRAKVVAVVPGGNEEVRSAIESGLLSSGWSRLEPHVAPNGFQFRPPSGPDLSFCSEDGAHRMVEIDRRDGESSMVVVHQMSAEMPYSRCRVRPERHLHPVPFEGVLPPLYPPEDARLTDGGGGASDRTVESRAEIRTEAGLAALMEHFARQLEEAGWLRTGGTAGEEASVSSWRFEHEGEAWRGQLVGVATTGEPMRYFTLVANHVPDAGPSR